MNKRVIRFTIVLCMFVVGCGASEPATHAAPASGGEEPENRGPVRDEPELGDSEPASNPAGGSAQDREAQLYQARVLMFFRRGWASPTTISEAERGRLEVEVEVVVSEDLHIVSYRVRRASGNADFDESVVGQIERLKADNVEFPEPPPAVRAHYIGVPVILRLRSR